jgi:uncharacterized glyoxalase superfamily protein PhnB
MRFNAHISDDGKCQAAFELYKECLGGEITLMTTCGSVPAEASSPELRDKIAHATRKVGDQTRTGADS